MMVKYYMLFITCTMAGTAFCSTKSGLDDDLYRSLRETAHRPCYENLTFDKENVQDAALRKGGHKPDYTDEVVVIDHGGETLTIRKKKPKAAK